MLLSAHSGPSKFWLTLPPNAVQHEREKTTVFVQGDPGTSGEFDTRMYRYAISETAQLPNYAEECFKVLKLPR